MANVGIRSSKNLSTVNPILGDVVEAAMRAAPPWLDFAVICGLRTQAEQQALWKKGRNKKGKIVDRSKVVTFRDGVNLRSNHQDAKAVDIAAYNKDGITWDKTRTAAVAAFIIGFAAARGIKLTGGVEWNWDFGHLELR